MRIKTLGVLVVSVLALFTMFYWLTDAGRLTTRQQDEKTAQLDFGKEVFANNPSDPSAAGCARCHGADGTGGPVPGQQNVRAPNLHSPSIAAKLKVNSDYVHLVVSYGGIVVSGNPSSLMPAWSTEVGGPLTVQQIDAVVALVTSWAEENAGASQSQVPNTAEAGQQVYNSAGCVACHQADLGGVPGTYPSLKNVGNEIGTGLPTEPSGLAQMKADYAKDPVDFFTKWIRDSTNNYNGGTATGMPAFAQAQLSDDQLQALITFLLTQKQ
jgi:mono/diheme cytochrome c family protein